MTKEERDELNRAEREWNRRHGVNVPLTSYQRGFAFLRSKGIKGAKVYNRAGT